MKDVKFGDQFVLGRFLTQANGHPKTRDRE